MFNHWNERDRPGLGFGVRALNEMLLSMASADNVYSSEIGRLARAVVVDPSHVPTSGDPLLRVAVAKVVEELDDYDRTLLRRVGPDGPGSSSCSGVESAIAFRIESVRRSLRGAIAELEGRRPGG